MERNELDAFAGTLQRLMNKLVLDYERCDRLCLARHGVTVSQAYTLLALPQESDVTMKALSGTMRLATSTMTRMIDQLVRKGLVNRRPDHKDRRIVRVRLTARGQNVRRTLEHAQQEFLQKALDGTREDERPTIVSALGRLTKSLANALEAYGAD